MLNFQRVDKNTILGWWFGTFFTFWESPAQVTNSYFSDEGLNHQPDPCTIYPLANIYIYSPYTIHNYGKSPSIYIIFHSKLPVARKSRGCTRRLGSSSCWRCCRWEKTWDGYDIGVHYGGRIWIYIYIYIYTYTYIYICIFAELVIWGSKALQWCLWLPT